MRRSHIEKLLLSLLVSLSLAVVSIGGFARVHTARKPVARAELVRIGQPAPSLNVRTLEGTAFNNASLAGSPTLLQFWTTTCAGCRDDQVAVDEIDSKFAGQGLMVLAINEGEPAATVQKFLHEHPRTVRIALDQNREISRRFGRHTNPYYVLIDRQGRIAGTLRGAAGQQGLMSLLTRAGLQERQPAQARSLSPKSAIQEVPQVSTKDQNKSVKPDNAPGAILDANVAANTGNSREAAEQKLAGEDKQPGANMPAQATEGKLGEKAAEEPRKPSGMKVIDIPPDKNSRPGQPLPKAVFVLTNGERLESDRYTMDTKYLHVAVDGDERIIAISAVDVKATESANRARGVDLRIPTSKSEVFVSF